MVRSMLKYEANKSMKIFAKNLKAIHIATDEKTTLRQLDMVSEK